MKQNNRGKKLVEAVKAQANAAKAGKPEVNLGPLTEEEMQRLALAATAGVAPDVLSPEDFRVIVLWAIEQLVGYGMLRMALLGELVLRVREGDVEVRAADEDEQAALAKAFVRAQAEAKEGHNE